MHLVWKILLIFTLGQSYLFESLWIQLLWLLLDINRTGYGFFLFKLLLRNIIK